VRDGAQFDVCWRPTRGDAVTSVAALGELGDVPCRKEYIDGGAVDRARRACTRSDREGRIRSHAGFASVPSTPVSAMIRRYVFAIDECYIFTMSTRVRSQSLCATAAPLCVSSSVTFAGCTMMRAYVPAARRLASVPGLMTMTDSTTWMC